MNVLAIGADPAELLIAAGGTLKLYTDRKVEPYAAIVSTEVPTESEQSQYLKAFSDVGTTLLDFVEFDTVSDTRTSRDALMDSIREVSPEVIIAPSGNSTRDNERELATLVFGAAYCACVPNYKSPRGIEALSVRAVILHTDPTLGFASGTPEYVDITEVWEAKKQAIQRLSAAGKHLATAEALAGARGVQVQRERAEAFGQEPAWGRLRPFRVLP